MRFLKAAVFAAAFILAAPLVAYAQSATAPANSNVYVQPVLTATIPYLVDILLALFFGLAALVAGWLKSKWNIDITARLKEIEAKDRDAMHSAIGSAVASLVTKMGDPAKLSFSVGSPDLAFVMNAIAKSTPDAFKNLAPTPDVVGKIAEAKLIQVGAALLPITAMAAAASTPG